MAVPFLKMQNRPCCGASHGQSAVSIGCEGISSKSIYICFLTDGNFLGSVGVIYFSFFLNEIASLSVK